MAELQTYSQRQLIALGTLSVNDVSRIMLCRRDHNKLGFAYQLIFVKLNNFFPNYEPFELQHEILTFASLQINIEQGVITSYTMRQQTIYDHQNQIRDYLKLLKFDEIAQQCVEKFIFNEALRLENSSAILTKTQEFLRDNKWLRPSLDTLRRIIGTQKEKAKTHIYQSINSQLNHTIIDNLNALIATDEDKSSQIEFLKSPPSIASPKSILILIDKLKLIKGTGAQSINISVISNNYQRLLFKYANRCSAHRLRQLEENHRYTVLVCFLLQIYQDTVDYVIDTHFKLIGKVYKSAKSELILALHQRRQSINNSLVAFNRIGITILDDGIHNEQLREAIFKKISKDDLIQCINSTDEIISGKYSDTFRLVTKRYSYLRQFAPSLLEHIEFESNGNSDIIEAIDTLKGLNDDNKRKLPDDAPLTLSPLNYKKSLKLMGWLRNQIGKLHS